MAERIRAKSDAKDIERLRHERGEERRAHEVTRERLKAVLYALQKLSKEVERDGRVKSAWAPDHACLRCMPLTPLTVEGFACERHHALDIIASESSVAEVLKSGLPEVAP